MRNANQINPFLPRLLLILVFTTAMERKANQGKQLSEERKGKDALLASHYAGTQLTPPGQSPSLLSPLLSFTYHRVGPKALIQPGLRETVTGSQKDPV